MQTKYQPIARDAMAYVLAGGRGSRLAELTDRRAKPAVHFGGKARIIDFALSNALNSGIRRIGGKGRAIHQQFLRNTAADDAGAAWAAFLDYRHARAMAGGNPRCTDAAGTGTDHNQVELKCHGSGLSGWWTRP